MRDGATLHRVIAIVVVAAGLSACAKHSIVACKVIPVPPNDSRSERMALPLDADAASKLTRSLTYGLNPANEREDVGAVANAATQYAGLIALLSVPNHPALQDLSTPSFRKWFPGALVQQVVDSRDTSTPAQERGPVAANDGTYWWIFYRDSDALTAVMVAKINACQNLVEAKR